MIIDFWIYVRSLFNNNNLRKKYNIVSLDTRLSAYYWSVRRAGQRRRTGTMTLAGRRATPSARPFVRKQKECVPCRRLAGHEWCSSSFPAPCVDNFSDCDFRFVMPVANKWVGAVHKFPSHMSWARHDVFSFSQTFPEEKLDHGTKISTLHFSLFVDV
jgi:hypothetical protein